MYRKYQMNTKYTIIIILMIFLLYNMVFRKDSIFYVFNYI